MIARASANGSGFMGEGLGMATVPINPNHLARLYPSVGAIVLYWGLIDTMVTHIAFLMFKVLKTPDANHKLPVMFGARLEILEANFKKHPEFAHLKDGGVQIIKSIREMQRLRDMLIHGVAASYEAKDDAIVFSRIDRLTPGQKRQSKSSAFSHSFNRMPVRFKTLEEASDRCISINAFLDGLVKHLQTL